MLPLNTIAKTLVLFPVLEFEIVAVVPDTEIVMLASLATSKYAKLVEVAVTNHIDFVPVVPVVNSKMCEPASMVYEALLLLLIIPRFTYETLSAIWS